MWGALRALSRAALTGLRAVMRARLSTDRLVLRLLAAAQAGLLILTVAFAGDLAVLPVIAVVVTGVAALVGRGDVFASLACYGACVWLWLAGGAAATSWFSIAVALELLLVYACHTLAATGPPDIALPRMLLLRWLRRTVWVAGATVAVGAVGIPASGAGMRGSSYAAATLLLLVAIGLGLLPRLFPPGGQDR